jgi:NitT/TauT family transport system permease protein
LHHQATDQLTRDQLAVEAAGRVDRATAVRSALRQIAVLALFIGLLAALYVGYKALSAAVDDAQTDWPVIGSVLPRGDDLNMPPLGDIFGQFAETPGGEDRTYARILLSEALFTLREAAVGFIAGVLIGLGIATALARWRVLERGLLPYVIASQTVPLIAIAPIIVIWGRQNLDFLPWEWQDWMSVSIIATYLTFFPVAVNGLRGLQSPSADHLELMESYAAGWGQSYRRLRIPAALPYLFAACKIAATASIVGAIVGEISAGVSGGLGRRLLNEAFNFTTGPDRLYASVIGAALLGLAAFALVAVTEQLVLRRQGREAM